VKVQLARQDFTTGVVEISNPLYGNPPNLEQDLLELHESIAQEKVRELYESPEFNRRMVFGFLAELGKRWKKVLPLDYAYSMAMVGWASAYTSKADPSWTTTKPRTKTSVNHGFIFITSRTEDMFTDYFSQ
jgi:hypothetical protein